MSGTPSRRDPLVAWRILDRPFLAALGTAVALGVAYLVARGPLLSLARDFRPEAQARHIDNVFVATAVVALAGIFVLRYGLRALMVVPFVLGPFWPADEQPVTGDEPHYLVIADSIVHDHDLAVLDDYRDPKLSPLGHLSWDLRHDRLSRYSVHQPGVAFLVAPGWAVADHRGARFMIAIAAALLLYEMVRTAETVGADRRTATIATALLYLGPGLLLMARTAFTEVPMALLVVHLFRRALEQERGRPLGPAAVASAAGAAALVPWFHLRFTILAALLAGAIALTGRGLQRFVPLVALGVSSVLVLVSFKAMYGSFRPSALYGRTEGFLQAPSARSFTGLLIDGHAGLVFAAPMAALALIAVVPAWRAAPRAMALAAAGAVASYVLDASWSHWWLDTATPGRFWVPLVPLTAPLLAIAWPRVVPSARAVIPWVLGAIAVAYLALPWAAYPVGPHGSTRLWSFAGLEHVLPTMIDGTGTTSVAAGIALAAALVAAVAFSAWQLRTPAAPIATSARTAPR